jgi:hypothetical protein
MTETMEQYLSTKTEDLKLRDAVQNGPIIDIGVKSLPEDPDTSIVTLREFDRDLQESLPGIMATPPGYSQVSVLLIYWTRSDRPHIAKEAKKLEAVCRTEFNFNTTLFAIPVGDDPINPLNQQISQTLASVNKKDENHLLILYYGGHGAQDNEDGKWVWKGSLGAPKEQDVEWGAFQPFLQVAECDIFFLFDCCFATAMIGNNRKPWKRRCEILGAAGAGDLDKGSGDSRYSFTAAVAKELLAQKSTPRFTVLHLYSLMTDRERMDGYPLQVSPHRRTFPGKKNLRGSISLVPLKDQNTRDRGVDDASLSSSSTLVSLGRLSDAKMLIRIHFGFPTEKPVLEEWEDWLKTRPPDIRSLEISWEGLYGSDSGLALVSIPIWLWTSLPQNPAYQHIGIIRSKNLLAAKPSQEPVPIVVGENVPSLPLAGPTAEMKKLPKTNPAIATRSKKKQAPPQSRAKARIFLPRLPPSGKKRPTSIGFWNTELSDDSDDTDEYDIFRSQPWENNKKTGLMSLASTETLFVRAIKGKTLPQTWVSKSRTGPVCVIANWRPKNGIRIERF